MGPTWVLSAPDGPHVGPMNLAVRDQTSEEADHCKCPGLCSACLHYYRGLLYYSHILHTLNVNELESNGVQLLSQELRCIAHLTRYSCPRDHYETLVQWMSFTNTGAPSGLPRTSGGLEQNTRGAVCFWAWNVIYSNPCPISIPTLSYFDISVTPPTPPRIS